MRTRSTAKPLDSSFDKQKKVVLPELGEAISLEDDTFIYSLYHHVASELAIDVFMKKSRFYSLAQRRWKLPRSCTKVLDNEIYGPL
jgi:hypothetical protein